MDGNKHLHVAAQLEIPCRVRDASYLDLIAGQSAQGARYHGNYRAARAWKRVVQYVTKEDAEPVSFGVEDLTAYLEALLAKKSGTLALVATRILKGEYKDMDTIFADHPSLLLTHRPQIQSALA
jgi:hypothetical protein